MYVLSYLVLSHYIFTVEWSHQSDFETIDGQQLITDIRHLSCVISGLEKVKIIIIDFLVIWFAEGGLQQFATSAKLNSAKASSLI